MARLAMIQTKADVPAGLKILEKILITDQPPKKSTRYPRWLKEYPCLLKEAGEKSM